MDVSSEIKIPIYGIVFELILTDDIWNYHIKNNISGIREEVDNYAALTLEFSTEKDQTRRCIIFRDDYYSIGCIAHEAFHLTCRVMKTIGMNLTDSSEEGYAYLITWLTEAITEGLILLRVRKEILNQPMKVYPTNGVITYQF